MTHVSVIIPTYDRAEFLLTRSIPSVLAQTHQDLDLHVVGDGATDEVVAAMATITDPRFRFTQRERAKYPPDALDAWHTSGSAAANFGLDEAQGKIVCVIGDDDEYMPTYVEELLAKIESGYDAAYCESEVVVEGNVIGYLGKDYPPKFARQSGGELMWKLSDLRFDEHCWRRGLPNDWDLFSRIIGRGYRIGHVRKPLYRYHPGRHIPPCEAEP